MTTGTRATTPRTIRKGTGVAIAAVALQALAAGALAAPAQAAPAAMPAVYVAPTPPGNCAAVNLIRRAGRPLVLSAFCGHKLTSVEMVGAFRRAGVPWGSQMVAAVETGLAESGGYSQAIFYNRHPVTGAVMSTDTGFLQINDVWHPEIKANRYDPNYSAQIGWNIARSYGWSTWNGYSIRGSQFARQANNYIAWARAAGVR